MHYVGPQLADQSMQIPEADQIRLRRHASAHVHVMDSDATRLDLACPGCRRASRVDFEAAIPQVGQLVEEEEANRKIGRRELEHSHKCDYSKSQSVGNDS